MDVIGKLNGAINAGLADPRLKARLVALGTIPIPMTPADYKNSIADETAQWDKVIRFAGIKLG